MTRRNDEEGDEARLVAALGAWSPPECGPSRNTKEPGIRATPIAVLEVHRDQRAQVRQGGVPPPSLVDVLLKRIGRLENQVEDLSERLENFLRSQDNKGQDSQDGEAQGVQPVDQPSVSTPPGMAPLPGEAGGGTICPGGARAIPLRDL